MALFHSSVIVTTTAVDTRTRDLISFPFLARPQAMTIYVRFVETGNISGAATKRVVQIGATTDASPRLTVFWNTSGYAVLYGNGFGSVSSGNQNPATVGALVELRATLSASGSVQIGMSVAGAAETTSSASAALVLPVAWSDTKISYNSIGSTDVGLIALRNVSVVAGVKTMQEMRRLAKVV